MVLEKTLESPLDCKEIQPVHSKGDQSWVFFGRNDAKAETPVLWSPHVKSWLIGKNPGAGRDWGQDEKGTTEDEMAEWHHGLDGREFEWTLGVGDGQGGLACCDSWGHKESDTTELNWGIALRQGVFQHLWTGRIEGEKGSATHSAGYLQGQGSLDSLSSNHWVLFLLSRNETNQLLLQRLRYPELISNDGVLRRNLISVHGFCYISCSF